MARFLVTRACPPGRGERSDSRAPPARVSPDRSGAARQGDLRSRHSRRSRGPAPSSSHSSGDRNPEGIDLSSVGGRLRAVPADAVDPEFDAPRAKDAGLALDSRECAVLVVDGEVIPARRREGLHQPSSAAHECERYLSRRDHREMSCLSSLGISAQACVFPQCRGGGLPILTPGDRRGSGAVVAHDVANVGVAGSNPVFRSWYNRRTAAM